MDGIIVINKPQGCTSHDVVYKVKKITRQKVGHTGTLDPNATGVLPLLIGKATSISKYLINHDKEYEVCLKLGQKTDTADIEGKIIEEKEVKYELLNKENVQAVLKSFKGKQKQTPPMYSAIKLNGKKLYEYARMGQNIEIKPRDIEIYDIDLLSINKDEINFKVHCSKGTYIRSLVQDIAKKLETVGYMKALKRTKVGEFTIEDSITIEEIEKNTKNFISIEQFFKDKESIVLNNRKLELLLNGVKITYELEDGIYKIYDQDEKFIGIATIKNNLLKRDVIIN